ncbi:MAG: DUF2147 domain-containing protein [Saprospiraceae bacterium]|nr:DUF2147 domain-containing protein [Saprospiraceae bacterium]
MTFLVTILFFLVNGLAAQTSPVGIWKTIDDKTGEPKSHMEIYQQNGKLYGKIVKLLKVPSDKKCVACEGARKDKPLLGMVIVENLTPYEEYWKGGTIIDPASGSSYACSIWFEKGVKDELKVRGKHWSGIYRTQTWYRIK